MATSEYQLPLTKVNLSDTGGSTTRERVAVQGDQGRSILLDVWNGTARYSGAAGSLGFLAATKAGEVVDTRTGYTEAGDYFALDLPDEVFESAGNVYCRVYAVDNGKKVQSGSFVISVAKQLEYDGTHNSLSVTMDGIVAQAQTQLDKLTAKVAVAFETIDVDGAVKAALQSTLDDIASWEAAQKAGITQDFAGLKVLQQQWTSTINSAQSTYESLADKATAMDSATGDATKAAGDANTAATKADTARTATEKATKAAADQTETTKKQGDAAAAAAQQITDQEDAIAKANTSLAALQTKLDSANVTAEAATITDPDLAAWIKQEAGE